jgi:hypothetical protein
MATPGTDEHKQECRDRLDQFLREPTERRYRKLLNYLDDAKRAYEKQLQTDEDCPTSEGRQTAKDWAEATPENEGEERVVWAAKAICSLSNRPDWSTSIYEARHPTGETVWRYEGRVFVVTKEGLVWAL